MGVQVPAASTSYAVSLEDVQEAGQRIKPYAHITPLLTCETIDRLSGRSVYFKAEMFQKGGAFKFRGASNAVFSLSEDQARRGVVTHSSGNHAGALALAAKLRGIPAYIVVPNGAPQCKLDAIKIYGGEVTMCDATLDAREATCARIKEQTGAVLIPPFNYGPVMSGQGTIALEILEQAKDGLDAIIVPVSGGGLIAGIAIAAKALQPSITIIAAEPTGSNGGADVAASKAAGHLVRLPKPHTIADGLQAALGDLTWPPVRDLVAGVVTVSDTEIVAAMRLGFERLKVVIEPSGATSLAAVLSPQFQEHPEWSKYRRVAVVLSGGNIDMAAKGFWDLWT